MIDIFTRPVNYDGCTWCKGGLEKVTQSGCSITKDYKYMYL